MERVRILSLKGLSRRQFVLIRDGQAEAARVWTVCRDMHLTARQKTTSWPGRNEYHEFTKGGRFALYSQSIQQVFRAFDAAVDATCENRRNGRVEGRYPYKDKRFFPLMWPAQAMRCEERRIHLADGPESPLFSLRAPGLAHGTLCLQGGLERAA